MDNSALIQNFSGSVEEIQKAQAQLDERLLYAEKWLDKLIDNMNDMNGKLRRIKSENPNLTADESSGHQDRVSKNDFKELLEKLLQGSMDHLENRLSQKILTMLKELKETAGPAREIKIRQFKEAAASEHIDLSKLFRHEKFESNIEDIGIEEKEITGIEKSIEKLFKMKGNNKDK